MMKSKYDFLLASMLIIAVGGIGIWYISYLYNRHEGKELYEKVKNNRKVYVYDTFYNALNPAMYVTDEVEYYDLIDFYNKWKSKRESAFIKFPIEYLSFYHPMYVLNEHLPLNSLIEVADIDTITFDFKKCAVYIGTVHNNPPNDSLLQKDKEYWHSRDSLIHPYMVR